MGRTIRWIIIVLSTVGLLGAVESEEMHDDLVNLNSHRIRRSNFEDPRAALGSTGLGPSFRSKRDKNDGDDYAFKAEEDDLAAAAESVAAEENAIAAAIKTEQLRQSLRSNEVSHSVEQNKEANKQEESEHNQHGSLSAETEGLTTSESSSVPASSSSVDEHSDIPKDGSVAENGNSHDLSAVLSSRNDSHLQKLMSESSDLAKELRMVFDILAKREAQLVEEMERLKEALTGAVSILKKTEEANTGNTKRFRRNNYVQESPYKACVYIESSPEPQQSNYGYGRSSSSYNYNRKSNQQVYPPEPIVREFIPPQARTSNKDYDAYTDIDEASGSSSFGGRSQEKRTKKTNNKSKSVSGMGEDVDLSKVYWLKLPGSADTKTVRDKVQAVFSEVSGQGKDALIIPVSRGFLKAVRVKPSALKEAKYRYTRELKALKIKEVA